MFVWCGGMLELGIGWVYNIVIIIFVNFMFFGDIVVFFKYWLCDIIYLEIMVDNGIIFVFDILGIGYEFDYD